MVAMVMEDVVKEAEVEVKERDQKIAGQKTAKEALEIRCNRQAIKILVQKVVLVKAVLAEETVEEEALVEEIAV
ncbi:Hypothetical protein NTJ_05323 [Nesidiocoris tenuis]|uniref:Uncharacterized protein n=1 Tax=Nesidiocoris tenuis TaxID=355587 RepID=A0ABN7AJU0_9HEMI|nr:Hypothetical protein NTJ_05323 [Nesidiocoris tenuis]